MTNHFPEKTCKGEVKNGLNRRVKHLKKVKQTSADSWWTELKLIHAVAFRSQFQLNYSLFIAAPYVMGLAIWLRGYIFEDKIYSQIIIWSLLALPVSIHFAHAIYVRRMERLYPKIKGARGNHLYRKRYIVYLLRIGATATIFLILNYLGIGQIKE